ncbi:MAG TPA: META domain-containing protein [Chitinophagaceae bacterium]
MNRTVVIIFAASMIILLSCAASNRSATRRTDLGGEWILQSIKGEKDPTTLYSESRMPAITIDTSKMTISGNNGCNRISGKYSFPGKEKIQFGPMISTKMACPNIGNGESVFMEAIAKCNAFSVENNTLVLKAGDREIMRLTKK